MDSQTLIEQMRLVGLWPQDEATGQCVVALGLKHASDVRGLCRELLHARRADCLSS